VIPSHRLKQQKRALRREMLVRRDAMPQQDRAERSDRIAERLLALPELASARTVMAFSSFGSEIDTAPILDGLIARDVRLALPRISGGEIEAVGYRPGDDTTTAAFGALEPAAGSVLADAELDAVVTPGVAFDRRGFRVGYGGGYYDRLFRRIRPDAFRVAIGFAIQVVEAVPRGTTDLPVDALVTEEGVTRFPHG
jgi:5-formyltetrahydrofolate cyclo-ligase